MYLCFRSCPDGHMVFPTSRVVVLSSNGGVDWEQVHAFSVPDRDVRDAHFLSFKDQLFVYTGTWYCGDLAPEGNWRHPEMNQQLGYAAVSADGRSWSEPIALEGTYGHQRLSCVSSCTPSASPIISDATAANVLSIPCPSLPDECFFLNALQSTVF